VRAAALTAFVVAITVLIPVALSEPQHGDEAQYLWSAGYYGARIAHLDFGPGTDELSDPGWAPPSYWNLTQPMGARAVYALTMGLTRTPAPPVRNHYSPSTSPADELVDPRTLLATRLAAVFCAALGFSFIALRLGWRGTAVAVLLLTLPQVRGDLARAWAEGPLLLGFGLATLSYGTKWFALAAGLAATFKLTALPLWGLVFLTTPIGRSKVRHVLGLLASAAVWTALTPPAWFSGGPSFLKPMLIDRILEFHAQAGTFAGQAGYYFPSRYAWPLELAGLLVAFVVIPRWWGSVRAGALRHLQKAGAMRVV
jgi:hypothetical protein